jgi:4-diphosphocytidyl-2-C-methyl-D-erythritol kinase
MKKFTVKAYAKINLGLMILEKRTDGYHNIETIFHPVDIFDTITLSLSDNKSVAVTCSHPDVPSDESNLCHKAAVLFGESAGIQEGIQIHIKKNIPVGAGLGGGSSDAAAVIRSLSELYGFPLTDKELYSLAVSVGSDVPFFLKPGTAFATGRGEILNYFDLKLPYWIVVAFPNILVNTGWAYKSFRKSESAKDIDLKNLVTENLLKPRVWVNSLRNDFEPHVFSEYPAILHVKERLLKGGADFALLSGSGSSVFGLYQDERFAREIATELRDSCGTWITEPFFQPDFSLMDIF